MEKIIELFNKPQLELNYLDSMILALVLLIPLLIIISVAYFILKERRK